jgi:heme A synthase
MNRKNRGAHKGLVTMAKNVGPEDRVVRIVIGLVLAVLAYLQVLPGIATIVMAVAAAYLIITGLFARCLFYKVADIDTSIQEQPYSTTDDRAGL